MSGSSLAFKKKQKNFYSSYFHNTVNVLIFSVFLNLVLIGVVQNKLMHIASTDFYASDGISQPILLTPLSAPNKSSIPLLPDDPAEEMMMRTLPANM